MKKSVVLALIFLLICGASLGGGVASAATGTYTHPSGAFSLTEFGALEEEVDNGALFAGDDAIVAVLFGQAPIEVTEETLPGVVSPILDGIQEFDDYELNLETIESQGDSFLIHFEATPGEAGSDYSAGDVFVIQNGDYLYLMLLLAADYEAVADAWLETVNSFTVETPVLEEEAVVEEEEEAVETGPKEAVVPAEGIISSGFLPELNGFSFENYGGETGATDLTPVELQRMFGDGVCASLAKGECTLTPPAQQWMKQINSYMSGGHCEGMAVLSALMYYNQVDPAQFGGEIAHDLLPTNEDLQREIAYWWTTQGTYPGAAIKVSESPSAVLDALIEHFAQGQDAPEWWAMGFYRRDGSAGHAVTPIGVEDKGDGFYDILIYDNNFPDETRVVQVDTNSNTWQYEGSPNPEIESFLYDGDADLQNLEIVAISPRLEQQSCDFCAGGGATDGQTLNSAPKQATLKQAQASAYPAWSDVQQRWALLIDGQTTDFYQIWLSGKSDLLIVDFWGRRIGYDGGEFVNEIPGASTQNMRIFFQQEEGSGLDKDKSPVYRLPVGLSFTVNVDGSALEEGSSSDVSMIGPGYYLDVSDIWLEPGEVDSITVYIDKSRHQLNYYTDYSESPDIEMGLETEEADYALIVRATELVGAEDSFDIGLDMATNEFLLNTSYNTDPSTYELYVLRIDDEGEWVFGANDMVMEPENTAFIPFTEWEGPGSPLWVQFDYENDGEVDEQFELPDITGEMDFYAAEESDNAAEFAPEAGMFNIYLFNDSGNEVTFTVDIDQPDNELILEPNSSGYLSFEGSGVANYIISTPDGDVEGTVEIVPDQSWAIDLADDGFTDPYQLYP